MCSSDSKSTKNTHLKRVSFIVGYWLFGLKNQSFRTKSGKMQPIRTKFGIRGQVKGWQRSENFGRDRPTSAKIGAGTSPMEPKFFLFGKPRNLSETSQWLIFTKFGHETRKTLSKISTLGVICPQNLTSKLGQTGTSLRAGYRSRDALQRDTVYSTW